MSFKTIRPQIKTLLEGTSKFSEVVGYPKLKFAGYPAAYVIPSDNDNDYETNRENTRVYAFLVRCFVETKYRGIDEAIEAMEDLVDTVLDVLDEEDLKSSSTRTVAVSLPAKYTFLQILAHPSDWGEVTDPALLMAEITVRVKISVDIS